MARESVNGIYSVDSLMHIGYDSLPHGGGMMRVTMLVLVLLAVFALLAFSNTDDCGCAPSAPNEDERVGNFDANVEADILHTQTEGMEWQCVYWYECAEYGMVPCDPCYSVCIAGCVLGCTGLPFWETILCNAACMAFCEGCPECEVCVRWERRKSCGWVFTE
jgi:hypothetical protein